MSSKTERECEVKVRTWGFKHVFAWADSPNAHYPPHKHEGLTTHLIVRGQFTITYPKDPSPTKETFGPSGRIDVDANKVYEVWVGEEGCTYVVGEWINIVSCTASFTNN